MINEGSYIVIDRSSSSSLKIYKIRLTVTYHHIAGIEVPVQKSVCIFLKKVVCELFKVILKKYLIEFQA